MNGKHWAIEHGTKADYLPGPPHNETAADAEQTWREARNLWFLAVTVRPTTPEEDARLGSPTDISNKFG